MQGLLAHRNQYVLGPAPVRVRPDWICVPVGQRLVLSHCPKLRVQHLRSRDGIAHHLLGLAVPCDPDQASIAEHFCRKDAAEIEPWTGYWAGNWLLISERQCLQDASGSLGLMYRRVNGEVWISSSSALLGKHLPDAPPAARIPWRVPHNKGTDWIPAPFTMRQDVYKLLPQRTMDPRDGAIRAIRFQAREWVPDGLCKALATTLKTILVNWARSGHRQHWVSLTAGLDTRTILAAALATRVGIQTYTTHYPITLRRDLRLPPRLAALAGIPYTMRKLTPLEEHERAARWAAISEHLDRATFHPIWDYVSGHDDRVMDDGERIYTTGNCFELGQCFYWDKFSNIGLGAALPTVDQMLDTFAFKSAWRPEPIGAWRAAMQSWIDSLSEPVALDLDWRDRFYLDQRLGGWHAILAQGQSIFDAVRFCPANCLWVFHLLLQFPPEKRRQAFAQKEAIHLLAPALMRLPINPQPWPKRARQLARAVLGAGMAHRLKRLAGLAPQVAALSLPLA